MEQNKTLTANNPTNEKKTITVNSNGVVQESVKQKSFSSKLDFAYDFQKDKHKKFP